MKNLGKFKLAVGHNCFQSSREWHFQLLPRLTSRCTLPHRHLTSWTTKKAWSASMTHLSRNTEVLNF